MKKMGDTSYSKKISALKKQKARSEQVITDHESKISKQKEKLKEIDLEILSLALNHANISAENAADMIDEKIRELKKTVLHDTENSTTDTTIQEHKHYYGGNDNDY